MPRFLRRWRAHWRSIRNSEERDGKLLQELIRNRTLLQEFRPTLNDIENKIDALRQEDVTRAQEVERRIEACDPVWSWFSFLDDSDLAKRRIISLTELMIPCKAEGFGKVRLGNAHDGGYVCLDDFQGIEAALSLGISDDVSWDIEVADKSIPVYQYDHSVDGPPVSHPGFLFHKNRIGTGRAMARPSQRLLRKNGWTTRPMKPFRYSHRLPENFTALMRCWTTNGFTAQCGLLLN